jgi:hypothetical protein
MTMVERIARWLCAQNGGNPDSTTTTHSGFQSSISANPAVKGRPKWSDYVDQARQLLAEMREATEAMLLASVGSNADLASENDMFWKGMIDAARAGA